MDRSPERVLIISGGLLVFSIIAQFSLLVVFEWGHRADRERQAKEDAASRARIENEVRAVAVAHLGENQWPSSSASAVRVVDLADSGGLYDGKAVFVIVRNWKASGGSILWFRFDTDKEAAVEFRMEPDQMPVKRILWIEGVCRGMEGGKIVVDNCKVINGN